MVSVDLSGEAGSVFGVTLVEASKAYHLEAKPQPQQAPDGNLEVECMQTSTMSRFRNIFSTEVEFAFGVLLFLHQAVDSLGNALYCTDFIFSSFC